MDRSIWTAGRVGAVVMIGIALLLAGCTGDSGNAEEDADTGELTVEISSSGDIEQFDKLEMSFSSATVVGDEGNEEIDANGTVDLAGIPEGSTEEISITGIPNGTYTAIALGLEDLEPIIDGSPADVIGVGGSIGVEKRFRIDGSTTTVRMSVEPVPIEDSNQWTLIAIPRSQEE